MTTEEFWDLIAQSKQASQGNDDLQIDILIDKLSTYSKSDIIGFERNFRKLIYTGLRFVT